MGRSSTDEMMLMLQKQRDESRLNAHSGSHPAHQTLQQHNTVADTQQSQQTQHNGTGRYEMIRSIAIRTEGPHAFEAGKIKVIDPKGHVVFNAPYSAGGMASGSGAIRMVNQPLENEIKPADLNGVYGSGPHKGEHVHVEHSLRITGTHVLFHDGFGGAKSQACFHMAHNDMEQLTKLYGKMKGLEPKYLHPEIDASNRGFNDAVEMLASKGLKFDNSHQVHAGPQHQPHLASAKDTSAHVKG